MVQKRKKTSSAEAGPSKRARKEPPQSPESSIADGGPHQTQVSWILPHKDGLKDERDWTRRNRRFAQSLYNRPGDAVSPERIPLHPPPLRTPLYTRSAADLTTDVSQPSTALRRLFNTIKHDSSNQIGRYFRPAFHQAFGDRDDIAIVASESNTSPVLTLDQDYRLTVTIRHEAPDGGEDRGETASLNFLRRIVTTTTNEGSTEQPSISTAELPQHSENVSSSTAQDIGYFIELPRGNRVTVNGRTYINEQLEETDNETETLPFIIGPLRLYTVVELLSQPIFFFRSLPDLKFTGQDKSKKAQPTNEELGLRSQLGDVDPERVEILWTPLLQQADVTMSDPPSPPGSDHEAASLAYDDLWMDNEEPIDDPHTYLRKRLYEPLRENHGELVSRVLLSINDRQDALAGFSAIVENETLRPGRTLFLPLDHPRYEHRVLLVFQLRLEAQRIEIAFQVLDPMAWRSRRSDRDDIFNLGRQFLIDHDWARSVFPSGDNIADHFPNSAQFINCAQIGELEHAVDGANTFTILNAWALALGLELNTGFCLTNLPYSADAFFTQAQWLFDLALHDRLHWKLVLAFLRSSGYIRTNDDSEGKGKGKGKGKARAVPEGDENDSSLPPVQRRFDLRVRPFAQLRREQKTNDDASKAMRNHMDVHFANVQTRLNMPEGRPHNEDFASDEWSAEFEQSVVVPLLQQGNWDLLATEQQLQTRLDPTAQTSQTLIPTSGEEPTGDEASSGTGNKGLPGSGIPKEDDATIPVDFDPCGHFHSRLEELSVNRRANLSSGQTEIDSDLIWRSISTVANALQQLLGPTHAMTIISPTAVPTPDDRFALWPFRTQDGRNILLLIRAAAARNSMERDMHVLDSAPWSHDADDRRELFEYLNNGTLTAQNLTWVFGPQELNSWQAGHFVILNAWSVLLGLPLNVSDFVPGENFFDHADMLISAALDGEADWKLIWAFLRCHRYVADDRQPDAERRFTTTVSDDQFDQHAKRMDGVDQNDDLFGYDVRYQYVEHEQSRRHNETFPWDHLDDEDRRIRIPHLQRTEQFNPKLTQTQLRNRYHNLEDDFDPCKYFCRERDRLLASDGTKKSLEEFRLREDLVTTEQNKWLEDNEIGLAIAAVTVAITQAQGIDGGYGFMSSYDVQSVCSGGELVSDDPRTIRPGRPMFVPIHIKNHYVLLVIALDAEMRPSFTIMDSKREHSKAAHRRIVLRNAYNIVNATQWFRSLWTKDTIIPVLPTRISWPPCSQQPSDAECGYYVILHAWALALGLEPNPDAELKWNRRFFQDLTDVLHLARMGMVDWRLIYAFLRCRNFVQQGHVPLDRQFANTVRLMEECDMTDSIYALQLQELTEEATENPELYKVNRLSFPPGETAHSDSDGSDSDKSSESKRKDFVKMLIKQGKLTAQHSEEQAREAMANFTRVDVEGLRDHLQSVLKDKKRSQEVLVQGILSYILDRHPGPDFLFTITPSELATNMLGFYTFLLDSSLEKNLFRSKFERPRIGRGMYAEDINLAIVAVTEAIDRLAGAQAGDDETFSGGMAFADELTLSMGLGAELPYDEDKVARLRRCFILPMTLHAQSVYRLKRLRLEASGEEGTPSPVNPADRRVHHLAAVVQRSTTSEAFIVYLLDSCQRALGEHYDAMYTMVEQAMHHFGWSKIRDTDNHVLLARGFVVDVPQQTGGGWQCGFHTVINAWIIAMGLEPNTEAVYTEEVYGEFGVLATVAVNGLLDWRTLVAWLFRHNLTVQTRWRQLARNRRFPMTRFWLNQNAIAERVDEVKTEDFLLKFIPEDALGYDYSCNNPFLSAMETLPETDDTDQEPDPNVEGSNEDGNQAAKEDTSDESKVQVENGGSWETEQDEDEDEDNDNDDDDDDEDQEMIGYAA